MSATSVWIPVSSAVAALFGGGFGAMLQGRYGTSGWRRQTRLEAYSRFVETLHDFDDQLADALDAFQQPDFDDRWKKVRDIYWQMLRAHSRIEIAGPQRVDLAAQEVVIKTEEIVRAGKDFMTLSTMVATRREKGSLGSYGKWQVWGESAGKFAAIARRELRTQGRSAGWPDKRRVWPWKI